MFGAGLIGVRLGMGLRMSSITAELGAGLTMWSLERGLSKPLPEAQRPRTLEIEFLLLLRDLLSLPCRVSSQRVRNLA